ncbi:hypothetical protein CK203_081877 [Vitis vinifera]|uniref:Uncharacterized protein n=1 Tax=Vitis vinifera TaxID=29760 RepID=A0A438EAF1_VITVI|nr:hypothetical protein CK203_081877 [Vitis vinifera]
MDPSWLMLSTSEGKARGCSPSNPPIIYLSQMGRLQEDSRLGLNLMSNHLLVPSGVKLPVNNALWLRKCSWDFQQQNISDIDDSSKETMNIDNSSISADGSIDSSSISADESFNSDSPDRGTYNRALEIESMDTRKKPADPGKMIIFETWGQLLVMVPFTVAITLFGASWANEREYIVPGFFPNSQTFFLITTLNFYVSIIGIVVGHVSPTFARGFHLIASCAPLYH